MSSKIVDKVAGIDMVLHDYCAFCPDFEAEVEKVDITTMKDPTKRTQTWIKCSNGERCVRLKERLEKEAAHAGTERL